MPATRREGLVLFDGVCNLCTGYVRFIIERDPTRCFRFASLQSELGRRLSREHDLRGLESMVLIMDGKAYRKSGAALRILKSLGAAWPICYVFIAVPAPLRDLVYDFIGNRRYRWFGKQDQCWIPEHDISDRFADIAATESPAPPTSSCRC